MIWVDWILIPICVLIALVLANERSKEIDGKIENMTAGEIMDGIALAWVLNFGKWWKNTDWIWNKKEEEYGK